MLRIVISLLTAFNKYLSYFLMIYGKGDPCFCEPTCTVTLARYRHSARIGREKTRKPDFFEDQRDLLKRSWMKKAQS